MSFRNRSVAFQRLNKSTCGDIRRHVPPSRHGRRPSRGVKRTGTKPVPEQIFFPPFVSSRRYLVPRHSQTAQFWFHPPLTACGSIRMPISNQPRRRRITRAFVSSIRYTAVSDSVYFNHPRTSVRRVICRWAVNTNSRDKGLYRFFDGCVS